MQISIGILVGNGAVGIISIIINAFKTRVSADSGIFEAQSCLDSTLSKLNNI